MPSRNLLVCILLYLGCPSGWVPHGSSCYYIDDTPKPNQNDARTTCQSMGGDLPFIASAEENQFVKDLVLKQNTVTLRGAWIGLQKNVTDSLFYWTDGTPLAGHYQNWNEGEPNNAKGNEGCVHTCPLNDPPGTWNDDPCNLKPDQNGYPVILCQKPI